MPISESQSAENQHEPSENAGTRTPDADQSTKREAVNNGPLNLEKIRAMRQSVQAAAAKPPQIKPKPQPNKSETQAEKTPPEIPQSAADSDAQTPIAPATSELATINSHAAAPTATNDSNQAKPATKNDRGGKFDSRKPRDSDRNKDQNNRDNEDPATDPNRVVAPKIAVPTVRTPLSDDQSRQMDEFLLDADLDALMIGSSDAKVGQALDEGERYTGQIIKVHNDSVFVSLGGSNEGVVPLLQFTDMPQAGTNIEVMVRGYNDEGMAELSLPGESVAVEDWSDIQSGSIVEAKIESHNTGGLECKVGGIRGFIPMSQIADYRVEDASEFVGQTLTCVVNEANERRGNLVLSHRAILERQKEEKKAERLAALSIGDVCEGTVRKLMDFGAFVDIGGLDGLIHISQMSWDRVKHPSEVVKEGDKVKVRIEKIDPDTSKIGLSLRSAEDDPWNDIEARFPTGNIISGTITRIAAFGAFVRLDTGIEGLIHVSELANRRVTSPAAVVEEGQTVEVKVLSVDRESQRISLSLKQAQQLPDDEASVAEGNSQEDEAPRQMAVAKHRGPLKGGTSLGGGGEKFGLKW